MQEARKEGRQQQHVVLVKGRYSRNPDFVFRRIADEMILVPVRSTGKAVGSVYTLNEVGAAVWNMLDEAKTLEEIRDGIVAQFDVATGTAEADAREFVEKLILAGAVLHLSEGD